MKKHLQVLCSPADREALAPILEALGAKGLRPTVTDQPGKDDLILAVLSENLYADEALSKRVLDLVAAGAENVLPLRLDDQAVSEALMNALYARNIIPAGERDAALLAERIVAALPKKKSRLPMALIAGAVVLAALAGVLIWRSAQKKTEAVPVMEETTAEAPVLPEGLTEADLAEIVDVIIVGDKTMFFTAEDLRQFRKDFGHDYEFATNYMQLAVLDEWDGVHWYDKETGSEMSMTRYDDLRFIGLMPNLRYVTLALVEADADRLPDLSGSEKLEGAELLSCGIDTLDWLAGTPIKSLSLHFTPVRNFGLLSSCEQLKEVHVDMFDTAVTADFSSFAPVRLEALELWHVNPDGDLDLSPLMGCDWLKSVFLGDLPCADLSFLKNARVLQELSLCQMQGLRDLSGLEGLPVKKLELSDSFALRDVTALGTLTALEEFEIRNCDAAADLSSLAGCTALREFQYRTEGGGRPLRGASFLTGLPKLQFINIENAELPDLEFLRGAGSRQGRVGFSFWGHIGDYSGLAGVKTFDWLSLDPIGDTPLEDITPWLEGAAVKDLSLHNFRTVDLSALPKVSGSLTLDRCDIEDLSTMPEDWSALYLELDKCSRLRSLEGLQNQTLIGKGGLGELVVGNCPRLTDWSALDGMDLGTLRITDCYALPSFAGLRVGTLQLERVADVTDLRFLDEMDASRPCNFELGGQDALTDLIPLSRFHGDYVYVAPQLAEQAEDLVEAGNFKWSGVVYPEGGWEMDDGEFTLLSMEELHTLPASLLRRVTSVTLAGDEIVDRDRYDMWEDYPDGKPVAVLHDPETDLRSEIPTGSISDLGEFFALTGLRELTVAAESVSDLDGIQALSQLERVEFKCCPELRDASPLFAMENLRELCLRGCPVESIQGIQNLDDLTRLDLFRVQVSDLSPLNGYDFSAAEAEGGFWLEIDDIPCEDLSPLGNVRLFRRLCLNNMDCALWIPVLRQAEIQSFQACSCGFTNESFAGFIAGHPELRELYIPWNDGITDLTPVLALEGLEYLRVSVDMQDAVDSLGQDRPFALEIEG